MRLGKTGLKDEPGVHGHGREGGQAGVESNPAGEGKFTALINEAYDRGVHVFDLADLYGTHPYVIPALNTIPRDNT